MDRLVVEVMEGLLGASLLMVMMLLLGGLSLQYPGVKIP